MRTVKTKPNRRRYQTFRAIEARTHYRKQEESPIQRMQRGICLNCEEPVCKRDWCEKIGNKDHKSEVNKKC